MKRLFLIGESLITGVKELLFIYLTYIFVFLNCRRVLEFVYSKFVKNLINNKMCKFLTISLKLFNICNLLFYNDNWVDRECFRYCDIYSD